MTLLGARAGGKNTRTGQPTNTRQCTDMEHGHRAGSGRRKMHKRLVALPGRQAAEYRRGGGREVVSISRVEGRTGDAARVPGVAASRKVRAREPQPRTLQRGTSRTPPPAAVDGIMQRWRCRGVNADEVAKSLHYHSDQSDRSLFVASHAITRRPTQHYHRITGSHVLCVLYDHV